MGTSHKRVNRARNRIANIKQPKSTTGQRSRLTDNRSFQMHSKQPLTTKLTLNVQFLVQNPNNKTQLDWTAAQEELINAFSLVPNL